MLLILGIKRKVRIKPQRKNATKFSKAVKQTMTDDVRNLTNRIYEQSGKKKMEDAA